MTNRVLHTIGYEGSSIADFLATLETAGIDLVIDVREVPISRKRGFSKVALGSWLESRSIRYLHLKGLGDPKAGRIAAREGRIDDFQSIFGTHLNSQIAQADLRNAIDAAGQNVACLLCFERDPTHCHRRIVAERMARSAGFRLVHLSVQSGLNSKIEIKYECTHGRASAPVG